MPGKAAKVIVSEKQQAILELFSKSRSVSASLAQRSKIIADNLTTLAITRWPRRSRRMHSILADDLRPS